MRNPVPFVGAVAAVVAATLVVPTSQAWAGPNCSTGYHCGWDIGFGTGKISFFTSDPDFRDNTFNTGVVADNNIRTVSNSTSTDYASFWYADVNYGGFLFCVNPNSSVQNLSDDGQPGNGVGLGNEASSVWLIAGGPWDGCY
ncbi:peptidase inhibitor family I36 protein [Umezawaea sp.]|uniref:peptidase inhibitor family I36 protein n=1 Tax=Umezawaea sp. TaxID=1955258 RepID=UPI002ED653C7